ncbi:MAG TPA: P27 family phage terminase small subunit [Negativicutes bacterium]|nr:P27 family phage terminase small subunit [Negativicutes bacterium]
MGRRGPRPGQGGRPRKALTEKMLDGNPGRRKLTVVNFPNIAEQSNADQPQPRELLSARQKSGHNLEATEIFTNTWLWLDQRGVAKIVFPQMLERYAMSAARWIQCEEAITEFGFLAKHPTTGSAIQSPYVAMSQSYMMQTNRLWYEIFQIVKENCGSDYSGITPQDDVMERLLTARRGK